MSVSFTIRKELNGSIDNASFLPSFDLAAARSRNSPSDVSEVLPLGLRWDLISSTIRDSDKFSILSGFLALWQLSTHLLNYFQDAYLQTWRVCCRKQHDLFLEGTEHNASSNLGMGLVGGRHCWFFMAN